MKFDFGAVDTHNSALGRAIDSMQDNCNTIQKAKDNLLSAYRGASAAGLEDITKQLQSKLDAYNTDLTDLRAKIGMTAGTGGDVHTIDQRGGARFRAI